MHTARRLRVAVVTESFLPELNGVTTSVCHVLEHLRDNGHEAMVIAPAATGGRDAPNEFAGFPVIRVPAIPYRQFPVGLPNPWLQRRLAEFQPDVLHAASPFMLGVQSIATARRLGVPSVAIYQTDVAGYAKRYGLAGFTNAAWRMVRWIHEGADLTLAPSTESMNALARAGVPNLDMWGRGVDLERFHPRNRTLPAVVEARRRLAPNGELLIGYVGRLAVEKRVDRLNALRGVEGIRIAIVGDGPERARLQRKLSGMPVEFLGARRGAELDAAYAAFDMFLHTGSEETFGQTLQEAFASGLPVIAPRAGGPIDLVDDGETGFLVQPDDGGQLRRAVTLLRDDHSLRLRMGEAGRRSVLRRDWASICDELVAHYRSVLAPVAA